MRAGPAVTRRAARARNDCPAGARAPSTLRSTPRPPAGKIDPKELKAAMQSLGFEAKNATVYSMIRDLSGEDAIDFDTFLEMMTAKVGDTDSREDINKVFNLFDVEGKGRINLRDLKRVAKELGETMSDAELLEMVERADRDGDSEITQDDFFLIMTRKVRRGGGGGGGRCGSAPLARAQALQLTRFHVSSLASFSAAGHLRLGAAGTKTKVYIGCCVREQPLGSHSGRPSTIPHCRAPAAVAVARKLA